MSDRTTTNKVAVDQLLYLLDAAFENGDWHSLLGNLRTVEPEEWDWVPAGGQRSIRDIVQHVGKCTYMYENHAFGDASLDWDDPLAVGSDAIGDPASAIAWLREGHARLRARIASLTDGELDRLRMAPWDELKPTRWIVEMMILHDVYHAGEINHLRSIQREDDRWA